jgi:dynein assembly factor 2
MTDVKLTAEEANKLDAAFGSEEFRTLLSSYVESLSDPRNREEQEAYISHLEANQELPVGKILLRPNPAFVVKCHKTDNDKRSKLFINMLYADEIPKPSTGEASNKGNVSVPYAIGPVRMEKDKGNNLVPTFDVCFHPLSLKYAHGSKAFLELVVDIAKSAVIQAYASSGESSIAVDSKYTILKNVRYKNGRPQVLIVDEMGSKGK